MTAERRARPGYVQVDKRTALQHRPRNMTRRARKRDAFVETVVPVEVFERDGWICGICRDAIDPAVSHPDLMCASVDHVIPLARHGKHEMANVQAAHLICNLRKSDRILVDLNG